MGRLKRWLVDAWWVWTHREFWRQHHGSSLDAINCYITSRNHGTSLDRADRAFADLDIALATGKGHVYPTAVAYGRGECFNIAVYDPIALVDPRS